MKDKIEDVIKAIDGLVISLNVLRGVMDEKSKPEEKTVKSKKETEPAKKEKSAKSKKPIEKPKENNPVEKPKENSTGKKSNSKSSEGKKVKTHSVKELLVKAAIISTEDKVDKKITKIAGTTDFNKIKSKHYKALTKMANKIIKKDSNKPKDDKPKDDKPKEIIYEDVYNILLKMSKEIGLNNVNKMIKDIAGVTVIKNIKDEFFEEIYLKAEKLLK
jgi:hypothetical protein